MFNYINESHIYFQTKQILNSLGWSPIAGEPSGGSDELPRVEIRNPMNSRKGSRGSYKIDLISTKDDFILLTEVKVNFDQSDVNKLNEITTIKLPDLKNALLERLGIDISHRKIIKSLALNKFKENSIPKDFVCFDIDSSSIINKKLLFEN